ncbi:MAG: hypothetical protein JWO13_1142 [Acidobacteriales bacterium]|nr:hypothetical protein [Terriglobales bacterium]
MCPPPDSIMIGERANHVKHAAQIRVEDGVPLLRVHLMQRLRERANPSVVYQDVKLPESLLHLFGQRFDRSEVGDVAFQSSNFAGIRPNRFGGLFQLLQVSAADHHIRAKSGQPFRDGRTYAPAAASDNGNLSS